MFRYINDNDSSGVYLFSTNGSPPNRFTNASSSKTPFEKQEEKVVEKRGEEKKKKKTGHKSTLYIFTINCKVMCVCILCMCLENCIRRHKAIFHRKADVRFLRITHMIVVYDTRLYIIIVCQKKNTFHMHR